MAIYDPIIVARFWSKVDVAKDTSECWPWRASTAGGYGRIKTKGETLRSNRLCWEIVNDEPLGDRHALHTCDNKLCCNPEHIYAGTPSDNMTDVHHRGKRMANKLSVEDVRHIQKMLARGVRQSEIAAIFNVGQSQISKINLGKTWKHVA